MLKLEYLVLCALFTISLGRVRKTLAYFEIAILNAGLYMLLSNYSCDSSKFDHFTLPSTFFYKIGSDKLSGISTFSRIGTFLLKFYTENLQSATGLSSTENIATGLSSTENIATGLSSTENIATGLSSNYSIDRNLLSSGKISYFSENVDIFLVFATFFTYILPLDNPIQFQMILRIPFFFLSFSGDDLIYFCICFASFFFFQIFAFLTKNRNFARKNFHFLFFFLLIKNSKGIIYFFQILIFFSAVTSKILLIPKFLPFLTHRTEKDSVCHVYLTGALAYPFFCLNYREFSLLVISICILDSFASIVGGLLKSKKRTIWGSIGGQVSSWIVEFLMFGRVDFTYHFLMGLVEFYCPGIDNITMSFCSVMYHKLIKA